MSQPSVKKCSPLSFNRANLVVPKKHNSQKKQSQNLNQESYPAKPGLSSCDGLAKFQGIGAEIGFSLLRPWMDATYLTTLAPNNKLYAVL